MKLRQSSSGDTRLHVWRDGDIYEAVHGPAFKSEWNNIQHCALPRLSTETVLSRDVRKGIPVKDNTFDTIYAYHVLEHLYPPDGLAFLKELKRVGKPNTIVRVSVPDLESHCQHYIESLNRYNDDPNYANKQDYWLSVYGLLDQFVRVESGGRLYELLKSGNFSADYCHTVFGDVFASHIAEDNTRLPQLKINDGLRQSVRDFLYRVTCRLVGHKAERTGQLEAWKYDEYALADQFRKAGFSDIRRVEYNVSRIPEWSRFNFDRSPLRETALDPGLFMEARI